MSTSHGEQYVELNRSLARLQGSLNRFNASVTLAGRLSTKSVNVAQLFAAMYVQGGTWQLSCPPLLC